MAVFVLPSMVSQASEPAGQPLLRGSGSMVAADLPPAAQGSSARSLAGAGTMSLAAAGALVLLRSGKRSKAARKAFDAAKEMGATAPLGYFDPLGLAKTEAAFNFNRSAEIKHGRVAMMASIGMVFQHYVKLPQLQDVPSGVAAITDEKVLPFTVGLFLLSGGLELFFWKEDPDQPGSCKDPMGLVNGAIFGGYNEEWRNREINNGRMAMIAVLGQVVAELVTGKDAVQQFH